jgi:hypothetical protein
MAGETTTTLDQEMLENSPGRETVEATLRDLLNRGLVTTERGPHLASSGEVFDDDWWDLTPAGRAAIGLPPTARDPHLRDYTSEPAGDGKRDWRTA